MRTKTHGVARLLCWLLALAMCLPLFGGISIMAEGEDPNVIDVTRYGADKTGATDSAEAIIAAIAAAKVQSNDGENAVTIQFPEGRYDIYPDKAEQRELYISNTVGANQLYKMKVIGMLFEGMKNITVDGGGSTIVLHGEMTSIVTIDCENITFQNFKLDVATPTTIDVIVESVEGNTATVFVPDCFNYEIVGNAVHWKSDKSPYTGEVYWTKYNTTTHANDTQDYLTRIQEHNPTTGMTLRVDKTVSPFANVSSIVSDGANRLTVTYASTPVVNVGSTYQMRDGLRAQCGTFFWKSKDIAMRNIDIYYLHGFGILGQTTENVTLYDVQFDAPKGTGRMTTAFADCVQMSGCKGKIDIQNCGFNNSHDDPINVHGTYLQVKAISEDRTQITVRYMHGASTGFPTFFVGDRVQLVRRDDLQSVGDYVGTVVAAQGPTGNSNLSGSGDMNLTVITLDTPVPEEVAVDTYVAENLSWIPEVYIAGCVFKEISSRGVLATTRKITIENNLFDRIGMAAVKLAEDTSSWYESGNTEDVTIRNNVFRGIKEQTIYVAPGNTATPYNEYTVHDQVLIEGNIFYMEEEPISDNSFYGSSLRLLDVKSVNRLIFQNNKILRADPSVETPPYLYKMQGARYVTFANNDYEAGLNAAGFATGWSWAVSGYSITDDQVNFQIVDLENLVNTVTTDTLERVGSSDATLATPFFAGADFGAFDTATTGYVATATADKLSYSFATADSGATMAVTLNGTSTAASVTDADILPGQNVIEVTVTAADGITMKYYTFTVLNCKSLATTPDTSWYDAGQREFVLYDAADLLGFSSLLASGTKFNGKTIKLGADIDLNPAWSASATAPVNLWSDPTGKTFEGVFDGQGHTVKGVYLTTATQKSKAGMFGRGWSNGTAVTAVRNLAIDNSYFAGSTSGESWFGAIFGSTEGKVEIDSVYIGKNVTVKGNYYTGGMVGVCEGSHVLNITNSVFAGAVVPNQYSGGFVGRVYIANVSLENCAFTGSIDAVSYIGGLVGQFAKGNANTKVTIKSCVSVGRVQGDSGRLNQVGSFVGQGQDQADVLTLSDSIYTHLYDRTGAITSTANPNYLINATQSGINTSTLKCISNSAIGSWKGYTSKVELDALGLTEWSAINGDFPLPTKVAEMIGADILGGDISWYSDSETEFVLTDSADLLGFSGLLAMGKNFSGKTVKLSADMDLNPGWTASAQKPENIWIPAHGKNFAGTFDGQGHTIKGIYLLVTGVDTGIFACVGTGSATVKNFAIENSYIYTTNRTVGGLFGYVTTNATVENVYLDIDMNSDYDQTTENAEIGGLVGRVYKGNLTVKNTVVASDITAMAGWVRPVGGFVGKVDGGSHTVTFDHCGYYGTIRTAGNSLSAGIGRVQDDNTTVTFNHCVMIGQAYGGNMGDAAWIGSFVAGFLSTSTLEIHNSIYTQTAYGSYTWVDQPVGSTGDTSTVTVTNTMCISKDDLAAWQGSVAYGDLTSVGITGWTALDGQAPMPATVAKYSEAYGKPVFVGWQATAAEDGAYTVRLLAVVESYEDIGQYGFHITLNGAPSGMDVKCRYVYEAVSGLYDGVSRTVTAESLGGNYLVALHVDGVPAAASYDFTVTPYMLTGENDARTESVAYTFTATPYVAE